MYKYVKSSKIIKHVDSNYGKFGDVSSHDMLIYIEHELRNASVFSDMYFEYQLNATFTRVSGNKADVMKITCEADHVSNSESAKYLRSKLPEVRAIAESVMSKYGYGDCLDHLTVKIYEGMDGFKKDRSYMAVEIRYDVVS